MVMANGSVKECKLGARHLLCLRLWRIADVKSNDTNMCGREM